MQSAITAIGTANPCHIQNQTEVAEAISKLLDLNKAHKRLLKSIYKSSGIEQRYSVINDNMAATFSTTADRMKIYQENALNLSLVAINNCLNAIKNFNKNDITHLITVSCTGMYAPGLDIEIIQHLHLPTSIKRTAVNFMGCYAAFNAIKIASDVCKADPEAKVLLVCIELCSIHLKKSLELDDLIANAIFADGSAAVLIESQPRRNKFFTLQSFHSNLLPNSNSAMAWEIGDFGFNIKLSTYVPAAISSGISAFTQELLSQNFISINDIDFYAIHPGGMKILEACEKSLNITKEQNKYAYSVLRNFGNMSSATVLFVLQAIWNDIEKTKHNKNIFSCAFGPGLTLESMLLRTYYVE